MTNKEITKYVESVSQRINELIFAFMERDISYQQAADEVLRRINRKRLTGSFPEIRVESLLRASTCSRGRV